MTDKNTPILRIKAISDEKYIKNNSFYKGMKGIPSFFLALILSILVFFIIQMFSQLINMIMMQKLSSGNDFTLIAIIFVVLLLIMPSIIDFFFINFVKSTTLKVYQDRVIFKTTFPIYIENEFDVKNIAEIQNWQTPEDKQNDIGHISIDVQGSKGAVMFFIPEYKQVLGTLKNLIS